MFRAQRDIMTTIACAPTAATSTHADGHAAWRSGARRVGYMDIPSDYVAGYEGARAIDPKLATTYVEHTQIADPLADEVMAKLSEFDQERSRELLHVAMDADDEEELRDLPPFMREFFHEISKEPDWVDHSAFIPGIRMFHRNSQLVLGSMVGGTLVEGFSTNISKSFFITGRLRDQGVRRLRQNNRHMVEMFIPGGLERSGDGWRLTVRLRLVHAAIRRLLNESGEWDHEAWGVPISSAHLGYAISAFSARLLKHLKNLGAVFDEEERASFMQVWRYDGYVMGIPEEVLFRDEASADRIFGIGSLCEPEPGMESVAMAHALVNSAPLVAGIEDPGERRRLSKYVFSVSRALIGNGMADQLMYPKSMTFGVLPWFRMQKRYETLLSRLFQKRRADSNFARFTGLFGVSQFDEEGITYGLPDHVYAERSTKW
ncbi:MAG: DUF2236 domain-containing protein [Chloroflexi bacterium]|nr:DUF2236 domain-containing protein [Chloroflexota bacterium]